MAEGVNRYSLIQRFLHWSIAAMVLGALAIGMMLGWLGYQGVVDAYGQATTNLLYKYHKTFGVLILGFMIVRIVVKLRLGKPAYAEPLTRFEHVASNAVHGLLYACLILMPALGWLATGAGGFPVEFFDWKLPGVLAKDKALSETLYMLHGAVGWLLLALIVAHIGGALKHAIVNMDKVMDRMF